MKRIFFVIAAITLFFGMISCNKVSESKLIGTWGVERIEYYYIDYYGQPISNTIEGYDYVPGDFDNGIELVFYEGHKGKWFDHDVDTILVEISIDPKVYDTIINPDTTLVTSFTYSLDQDIPALFIHTSDAETYMMEIEQLDNTTFSYKNEFKDNYVEHAILKRIPDGQTASKAMRSRAAHPRKPGSFFSHQSLNEKR